MSDNCLVLLPDQEFVLVCINCDGTNFVQVFRDVWHKIPSETRVAILEFWNQRRNYVEPPLDPYFEISNRLPVDIYGQVCLHGMELKFNSAAFEVFPDSIASWAIAHELAHVYQKTLGLTPGGPNCTENENHANSIAESWGFEPGSYLRMTMLQNDLGLSLESACLRADHLFHTQ